MARVTAAPPGDGIREHREQRLHRRRLRQELEHQLRRHREGSLATDDGGGDVVADHALLRAPPAAKRLAAHLHALEAEHVLAHHAVLEGARPAGVLRDVAAERARGQRRRIGREEEARRLDGVLQLERDHARLDDGDEIVGVDLAHLGHALGREHDAAARRQAAAGHAGAGAARRDRDAMLARQAQRRHHVVARFDEDGALGRKPAEARFVDEEALEALLVSDDLVGTELST